MAIKFKSRRIAIVLDDPEDCQQFLNGLILAKQNNSSDYFPQLIEGVNAVLQPYLDELATAMAQGRGVDAKVTVE